MSYKLISYGNKSKRRNYSKIITDVPLPNLIEIQTGSFKKFCEVDLAEIFEDISPICSTNQDLKLHFGTYHFEDSKYDIIESKIRDISYTRPLKVNVTLENSITGELQEQELFMGDIPYMTPVGTFVINGAERVIISQIVRSSGAYYAEEEDKKTGNQKFTSQIIPTRGAWIEYESDSKEIYYGKLDRSNKIPITTVLRAYGLSSDKRILDLFGDVVDLAATFEKDTSSTSDEAIIEVYSKLRQGEKVPVEGAKTFISSRLFDFRRYDLQKVGRYKYNLKFDILQRAKNHLLAADIVVGDKPMFDELTGEEITPYYIDPTTGEINEVSKPTTLFNKRDVIKGELKDFIDQNRHLFRRRVEMDNYLCDDPFVEQIDVIVVTGDDEKAVRIIGNDQREEKLHITMSDILASVSYFFTLYNNCGNVDDIDHLGNRRLRLIGELLKNQFRIGFSKLEKNIIDKMNTSDIENLTPQSLVNIKPLTSTLKEFFGSSQLSQFMDQINPLAEITQKRRISALGNGGIQRDRASVQVRDVHDSHYGRMCPIETPEGPSIGLITSLATYAKTNEYGFIETPYFICKNDENGRNRVTEEIEYLSATQEETVVIAAANSLLDENGYFLEEQVIGRKNGETEFVSPTVVNYMDVSPKQIVSVAASCVPFLEHNDATRALMGANMQRQAVPIINPDSPYVGTGMEHRAAKDSGSALVCEDDGIVEYVDAKKIDVKEDSGNIKEYKLYQFLRSNSATCVWQHPIVKVGEAVKVGDVLADGQSMRDGELALGKNCRIAFMTWNGYNYEDAVIMSERMVKEDWYTSLHVDKFEIEVRTTKLGKEEFTREVPNVSENDVKYLDENGIIIPGTEVKEGDILVGKVTPKGATDKTPEEKLMTEIFGLKSREVKNTSLKVPHGGGGIVQKVIHFKKKNGDELPTGVDEVVRVYVMQKRKIHEGDKMAGRHGNKGVISNILPEEDMPYTADGHPIDIMLNPQGVPSRMNIGQVLEMHAGIAAQKLGVKLATPVFDGIDMQDLEELMKEAGMAPDGKEVLYDGRTGEPFENRITVGIMYMIKLSHMVDDKLHARNVGHYTLVTQQPMGGKAQNGGQRFGEMEVWALEAYGASHTLQEMLTIKSDDMTGRNNAYSAITDGTDDFTSSLPESFRVLARELQALGLHTELITKDGENEIAKSILDYETSTNKKRR